MKPPAADSLRSLSDRSLLTFSATRSNVTYNASRSGAVSLETTVGGAVGVGVAITARLEDGSRDDSSTRLCWPPGESAISTKEGWSLAGLFRFRNVVDGLPGASAIQLQNNGERKEIKYLNIKVSHKPCGLKFQYQLTFPVAPATSISLLYLLIPDPD
jgi:hypothetical protein